MTSNDVHRSAACSVQYPGAPSPHAQPNDHPADVVTDMQRFGRLAAWARARGARTDAVTVVCSDGLRGLGLLADARSGGEVLFVPSNCWLRETSPRHAGQAGADEASPRARLAWLLCELQAAGNDDWRPFLDLLPSGFENHPLVCDEAALQYLPEFEAGVVREARAMIAADYDKLCEANPSAPRYEEFLWAHCCVLSRGFAEGEGRSCLVPLCDLMNHSFQPNCRTERSEAGLHVFALQDLAAGTPLLWEYAKEPNFVMAGVYGFCAEDNPYDRVMLHGPVVTPEMLRRLHAASLSEESLRYWIATVPARFDDPMSRGVLAAIRSILRDPLCRDAGAANPVPLDGLAGGTPADRAEELAALIELKAACDQVAARNCVLPELPCGATDCERAMAHLASRLVQSKLRILDHFRRLCDRAIPLLRGDDFSTARAGLADFPDEAYARELLAHAHHLWPRADTALRLLNA